MKTSQALLILDAIIVLSFIVVLPITNVLYTIVMLFIVENQCLLLLKDLILKAVTVISKYNKEISADIYEMTGRGQPY